MQKKPKKSRKPQSQSDPDPMTVSLIDLPIEDARREKWLRGRAEHGPIMELDPLDELFAECLDGTNYTSALLQERWTYEERKKLMRAEMAFVRIAKTVQAIKAANPRRQYTPRAIEFS